MYSNQANQTNEKENENNKSIWLKAFLVQKQTQNIKQTDTG
jgi:hypothetical protein